MWTQYEGTNIKLRKFFSQILLMGNALPNSTLLGNCRENIFREFINQVYCPR